MPIEVNFDGGKKVNAKINEFTIKTDQNIRSGGEGTAPEPFSLFLASLATCAGVYVQTFCDSRGIPVNNITLDMDYNFNREIKMVDHFDITIHVPDNFPEKYESAVINAASLCAVKRHLSDKITYAIHVVRQAGI
ncbi:MAG: OsmC family protein [Bacteroidota bacterium]|nr:OsmC family protein [Bacteroidota bacterium]